MPPQSGSWFWKSQFPFASHQPIMSPDKHLSPQSFPSQPWTLHGFISGCTHAPLPLQIPGRFPEVELSQSVMQDSPQGFPVHVPFSPKHLLQINWIQISVCLVITTIIICKFECEVFLDYTWRFLQLFVAAIFLTHTTLQFHRLITYFMTSKIGFSGGVFNKYTTSDPQWKPQPNYIGIKIDI